MRKLLLMMLIMIPLVYATDQCMDIMAPGDLPCIVVSTWDYPDNCDTYESVLYNESGDTIQSFTMGDIGIYCNFTFNYTATGQYYYNVSTGDTGSILVEGSKMWLLAVLLLPLGFCFFFIYLANSLEENHNPIKWFFRLLALVMIFVVYQGAHTIIALNPGYSDLARMFNISIYGWIFWTILVYFLIYIIYNIFMSFKDRSNKTWDMNEDFMQ